MRRSEILYLLKIKDFWSFYLLLNPIIFDHIHTNRRSDGKCPYIPVMIEFFIGKWYYEYKCIICEF